MQIVIEDDVNVRAKIAADIVQAALVKNPCAVIGVATGSSPLPVYQELIRRYQAGEISFAKARAFMLDEYVGIPSEHPERYRNVVEKEFAGQVDFAPGAVQGPDGNAENLWEACRAYDEAIAAAGGTDVQLLGIGSDGHIAFNEPGASLASTTHPEALTEQTRVDNARFFDDNLELVPTHAVTQGLATIMTSKHPLLLASGKKKAHAIAAMCEGAVSSLCPASILQMHPNVTVILDSEAASELKLADFYRYRWETRVEK